MDALNTLPPDPVLASPLALDPALRESTTANNLADLNKAQLGVEDFLKLLTTQLSNQNPMEPMSDMQFLGEMANFSSLNEMHELGKNFSLMAKSQSAVSANTYLGKEVFAVNENGKQITGIVNAINLNNGNEATLSINGEKVKMADVQSVKISGAPAA